MDGELYELCLRGINNRSLLDSDRVVIRKILAMMEELDRYRDAFGAVPEAATMEILDDVHFGG